MAWVGVTNPKSIILFAAILPQFVSHAGHAAMQMLILGVVAMLIALMAIAPGPNGRRRPFMVPAIPSIACWDAGSGRSGHDRSWSQPRHFRPQRASARESGPRPSWGGWPQRGSGQVDDLGDDVRELLVVGSDDIEGLEAGEGE